MTLQAQMINTAVQPNPSAQTLAMNAVKQVKVPAGCYIINTNEFRTFHKDCLDYQTQTNYTDAQVVLQMRLNMDSDLKCAIHTNFHDQWSAFNVNDAVKAVRSIVNHVSNPVV